METEMAAGKHKTHLGNNEKSGWIAAETVFGKMEKYEAGTVAHIMENISFPSTCILSSKHLHTLTHLFFTTNIRSW